MKKEKILVTGGAGYIGSFIVRDLRNEGYEPIIFDNLSQGHSQSVKDFTLIKGDLVTDLKALKNLFEKYKFFGVIHMASFIQMGESFKNPDKYFRNNLIGTINLLTMLIKYNILKIVFSSSAGVYGNPKRVPIEEDDPKNPENPYGEAKLMVERMLKWYDKAYGLRSISLRYFNAAGASDDGSIGEDHPNESHLIPVIIRSALSGKEFTLFGGDYDTKDGTCVRDYIHVKDLSQAHIRALKALEKGASTNFYNVGVGKGFSNLEIVKEIEKILERFKYKVGDRRPGDPGILYASIDKIEKELGWKPKYDLKTIINSAIKWHRKNPNGYASG